MIKKITELQMNIKNEMGKFLSNQHLLSKLKKNIDALKNQDQNLYNYLIEFYTRVSNNQTELESLAIDWIKRSADLKQKIEQNPVIAKYIETKQIPSQVFSMDFLVSLKQYSSDLPKLLNNGLVLLKKMIEHNTDVSVLKKSVETKSMAMVDVKGKIFESSIWWVYGILGVALTYILARSKRK